jgi:BirA family biotin operon repressor/biotin-[acetyl-CoA-carboxylase] ligase
VRLHCIEHGVVDSTSERAFAALADGTARHGDVHLATAQTAGRGRRGRSWWSPPGAGLYASLVLRPSTPIRSAAGLTMAGGLAVLDAVRRLGCGDARLDWPNDVVVAEAKLAGILVETRGLDPGAPHYVVGIGLNVLPTELPGERAVASLRGLGLAATVAAARDAVLAALPSRLAQLDDDAAGLAADYLLATRLQGRPVRLVCGEEECFGRLEALSLADGIRLRGPDGEARSLALEVVRELAPCL